MVMQEQARRLSEPLRWGKREKAAMASLLAVLAAALIALVAYGLTTGGKARTDCIRVTFASTLGGGDLHSCGAKARQICASGAFRSIRSELQQACEHAGFAYRAPS
jgi:hypothetical protein